LWESAIVEWDGVVFEMAQLAVFDILFDRVVGGFGVDFVFGGCVAGDFTNKVENEITSGGFTVN